MTLHAVSSLRRQLEKYLIEDDSWVDPSSRAMLEFAYNQVETALEFSKRVPFRNRNIRRPALDIEDAIRRLKGAHPSESRSEGIQNLEKKIHFFTQTMNKLEEDLENAGQLYSSLPVGGEEDEAVSDGDKPKMVGFSNHYNHLKEMLTDTSSTIFQVVSLCGMPGIGKTTLAREIFEDPDIVERFDCRVWVRVGRKCGFKEIPRRILVELSPHPVEEDADVVGRLNEILKGKRYLIVLDDVWDKHTAKFLKYPVYSSRRGNLLRYPYPFRDELNETRILVISRMQQVNELNTFEGGIRAMRLMNNEESWDLLHEIVFAEESCPFNLEIIGKKIAEKCEGLPLIIVAVANLLSKEDKTVEYWNEVATRKKHQLFKAAYDEIMKVLLPSYKHLPPSLRMCFLFIGVFPLNYEIPRSRLVNLWVADGFLEQDHETLTDTRAIILLEELVSNNMVMIKTTINSSLSVGLKGIKTCRLHSSLWHLSSREARSNKFCHVLDSLDDGFGEDIQSQRRLSFYNNILFTIIDVHESVERNCASTAHSLLCFGPYSQYQVPLCFGLRLLNKLDALTIRFYEFPIEVLQLVELRYLTLTLNGNLPPAISQLSKVEFLIVQPHQSIKSYEESSYLPKEIWNMKKLRHLQVTEKALPNPGGASLESLSTLLGASPNSCTVDVFRAIPNLKKLGIQVELLDDSSDGESFTCLSHVSQYLQSLSSAKCVIVNPNGIPSFPALSLFPSGLAKLTLNGLGYTWEEMSNIRSLQSLNMLKLRNYAFRGPEWDAREMQFPNLDSLIIEDTDLAIWKIGHEKLLISELILKHCYNLEEIHGEFGSYLHEIEMVDCNPLGVQQIKKLAHSLADVTVSCSWHD